VTSSNAAFFQPKETNINSCQNSTIMFSKQSPNLAAVLETAKARATIRILPIPEPGPDEILVRNHAVATNPVDWKIQDDAFYVTKVR
jgi:hypothetical protein